MTQYLEFLEEMFVKMDASSQPTHASSIEVLQMPDDASSDYVPRLVDALRAVKPINPFNKKLTGSGWHHWETVEVDMNYHVRHVSLPSPGSMKQLMDIAADIYGPMLNRSLPLWETWVIEGLEGNRFAILLKGHHAMTDGMNGLNAHWRSFSESSSDSRIRAPWGDNNDSSLHRGKVDLSAKKKELPVTKKLSEDAVASLASVAKALWPLKTKSSRLNGTPRDSVRRFGATKLPLKEMKAVSLVLESSVNDVLVALIDHATHRYLKMSGDHVSEPLAVVMPVSTRREGKSGGASNQVVTISASLGTPNVKISKRVIEVKDSLKSGIQAISQLSSGVQMGYTVILNALMPAISARASSYFPEQSLMGSSLSISNITPPRGAYYVSNPLYRGGARLEAYYIQPIINGGILLNVTVMCYHGMLNVGIGSVPGAVDDPMLFGTFMMDALKELLKEVGEVVPKPPDTKKVKPAPTRSSKVKAGKTSTATSTTRQKKSSPSKAIAKPGLTRASAKLPKKVGRLSVKKR